ncbi:thioredoxin family protein [Cellulomonas sp. P22]|uniref:thioredoxin family protein n=1 Tax=Cellulomonas sp. P22 TaxID=3373189 RepID=UPI0037ADBEAD
MLLRAVLVVTVLVAAAGLGVWWRSREGRFTLVPSGPTAPTDRAERLTATEIGIPLGERTTLLQLSSAVCAPCRRVREVLTELAAERPGTVHAELDVEQHLGLVRRLNVLRTPTVLVLDAAGTVVGRMSGATTRAQALAAIESCPGAVPGR